VRPARVGEGWDLTFYAFVNSSLVSAPTIAPGCAPRAASITVARALRVWY